VAQDKHNADDHIPLVMGLVAVAARLEPPEAAQHLSRAMPQEKDAYARGLLARSLVGVAQGLPSADAESVLAGALALKNIDSRTRAILAKGLADVAGSREPGEVTRVCVDAARSMSQVLDHTSDDLTRDAMIQQMSVLIQALDTDAARRSAQKIARWLIADPHFPTGEGGPLGRSASITFHSVSLERCFTHVPRPQASRRTATITSAIGASSSGPMAGIALLTAAAEPLPCRLTTQDLVELLKMPTCVCEVRKVILDQLGNRYRRRFDTHWDFVRYAQQQKLNLDFTTPPQRPDRQLPRLFEP
jgi:hypothetical protein